MKIKNDDEYFEPTAWQIMAKWFVSQAWLEFILVMALVLIVTGGVVAVLYSAANIDRSCVGDCKIIESYRRCRTEQPALGEEGCVLYIQP